jgi:hypothetical protein
MALALLTLTVLFVPSGVLQGALAQIDVDADTLIQETFDEVEQGIEQEAEQEAEQEQDQTQSNDQSADQSNTAEVSQDETNDQANVLDTGDNTASTTQVGDNDAVGNEVAAESEGGESGDAKAKKYSKASSEGGDAGDASADLSQNVDNEATTIQDSSADDNILANENTFGDDLAAIDQDNLADQDALNVGFQGQDLTQTTDQVQDAANINFDLDVQEAIQQELDEVIVTPGPPGPPGPEGPPGPPAPPEPEPVEFCVTFVTFGTTSGTECFPTSAECEAFQTALRDEFGVPLVFDPIVAECHPVT